MSCDASPAVMCGGGADEGSAPFLMTQFRSPKNARTWMMEMILIADDVVEIVDDAWERGDTKILTVDGDRRFAQKIRILSSCRGFDRNPSSPCRSMPIF
jgi:hypothetical protein